MRGTLRLMKRAYGFTIVELLIVIVVIAILAALSYVGYVNIANRANDSAVQSDLTQMAKMIELDAVERGGYLEGGSTAVGDSSQFPGLKFRPAKESYMVGMTNNLSYCEGSTAAGAKVFRVEARSKSGQTFRYESGAGLKSLGQVMTGPSQACNGLDSTSFSYGYYFVTDTWWSWTNG